MTGLQFLRAACSAGDTAAFRRVAAAFYTDEELPVREAARAHLLAHGELPTCEALAEYGFTLPAPRRAREDAVSYYEGSMRRRKAYDGVNSLQPELRESMEAMDMTRVAAVLRDMNVAVMAGSQQERWTTVSAQMRKVVEDLDLARASGGGVRGITTGWASLDAATHGMRAGDLVVLAGRPGMGKSYLLMEMAMACKATGRKTGFCSMEMDEEQLARRWLARRTGINANLLFDGDVGTWGRRRIGEALARESEGNQVHLLAGNMRKGVEALETMAEQFALDALYVDAAYLLQPTLRSKGYASRWEQLSEVIRDLKALAIDRRIPVVLTVQFNRNAKSNTNEKKQKRVNFDLADIAGTDTIPQDASIVLGAQYGPGRFRECTREITQLKNREGSCASFFTDFTFNPVSMAEVFLPEDETDEEMEQSVVDVGWMV